MAKDYQKSIILLRDIMIKSKISVWLSIILSSQMITPYVQQEPCSITNSSRGRFGDQLVTYFKVKWLAYKYGLKILYTPFKYSDQLVLDDIEELCTREKIQKFQSIIDFEKPSPNNNESQIIKKDGILYKTSLYCQVKHWSSKENKHFLDEIKKLIKPKKTLTTIELPNDRINVAVHVRKGGGYDRVLLSNPDAGRPNVVYSDIKLPLKFPSDDYYIDQIKFISQYFKNKPLYVYIFTDDKNPAQLLQKYEQALNNNNIIFDCRKEDNHYDKNVLEDLFSMIKFDCLIRPSSSFSLIVELLGNHAVVIYPIEASIKDNKIIIEKVSIITNKNLKKKLFLNNCIL